jgi:hypothetical protein
MMHPIVDSRFEPTESRNGQEIKWETARVAVTMTGEEKAK